jgi:methyl-accepting chemotaxis protein
MIARNKVTLRIVAGILVGIVPVVVIAAVLLTRANQSSLLSAYQGNVANGFRHSLSNQGENLSRYLDVWTVNPSFKSALEAAVSYGDITSMEARATETLASGELNAVGIYNLNGSAVVRVDKPEAAVLDLDAFVKSAAKSDRPYRAIYSVPQGLLFVAAAQAPVANQPNVLVIVANVLAAGDLTDIGRSVNGEVVLLRGGVAIAANEASNGKIAVNGDLQKAATEAQSSLQEISGAAENARFVTYVPVLETGRGNDAICGAVITDATGYMKAQRRSILIWVLTAAALILVATGVAVVVGGRIGASIKKAIVTLDNTAVETSASIGQIRSASQLLADGSSEQAASLEETSASLEEMSSMTKRNAESAAQAKDLSAQTRSAADHGMLAMTEMKRAMDDIKASSDGIAKIIKTIDEIAFQTNLLALNAAVEAARAGEAGAGFAVVADEVRSLARRSAESARETAEKIEEAIRKSEHGVSISAKVGDALGQIVDRAQKVDSLVGEIAEASQEQSRGISQVNGAVSQMDRITQTNASSAEETSSVALQLDAQAITLKTAIEGLHHLVSGVPTKNENSNDRRRDTPRRKAIRRDLHVVATR